MPGSRIPLLHIAEAAARRLTSQGIRKILLLGTKYTMQQAFYKEKLIAAGITVIIPEEDEMEMINQVIFQELCLGEIQAESRQKYIAVIEKYAVAGAAGVVLGCTEIGMLIRPEDVSVPVFDTAVIHAEEAAMWALDN